jgi:putative transferase (TIGR04331 family)
MPNTPRYLITSSDERTWKFDRPVVFLGEWCRTYNRQHIWQHMDAIVAKPYGLSLAQKDADNKETRELEKNLLPKLRVVLNEYHGVQYSTRLWRVILGHWLRRYVEMMLNRVKTLEQCLKSYEISGTTAYSSVHYTLATNDSYSAIWASNDNRWNNALIIRILDLMGVKNFTEDIIEDNISQSFCFNTFADTASLKRKFFKSSYQKVKQLASFLVRDHDALIISSYLPIKDEIKLQLALKQFPQLWTSPKLEVKEKFDRTLREKLARQFVSQSDNNLENILSLMLFELLPICYLEGFVSTTMLVKQQPWPKCPKFIFTSNNFDTDELFKFWVATRIETGSKYFIGQHGNNYGTSRYMHPSIEETTADKFLTWGWTDGLPQHTPAFLFKTLDRKAKSYDPQGGLILIELCLNHRHTTWDSTAEFFNYFSDQQRFIEELDIFPRQKLTVRLHGAHKFLDWCEKDRWADFDPSLRIDFGENPINNLIVNSRLIVHSYDSTGILQTLSQNIPTIAFWQNGLDHLRDSAKPYYQILVDAGIIYFTPEAVAHKVNTIWTDVDGWWAQKHIQEAINQFCIRYARFSENPVRDLKQLFLEKDYERN